MKRLKFFTLLLLILPAGIFFMGCDPELITKADPILRVYDVDLVDAELLHLSTLDPAKLSPEELAEKKTREDDLAFLKGNMEQIQFPFGAILETAIRIPPGPTPCPDVFGCLEPGTAIGSLTLGAFYDVPDAGGVRLASVPAPTVIIQIDPQHVFAKGQLKTPGDAVFKTAYFTFSVVDGTLAGKDLSMIITTSFMKDGKLQSTELIVPVPANTFSAN